MSNDLLETEFIEALRKYRDWVDYKTVFNEIGKDPDLTLVNKLEREEKIEIKDKVVETPLPSVGVTIKNPPGESENILIRIKPH